MSESALDRTARALDLVPYLLEHQGISIPELAQVFGVTEKQINDDLVLIHMCGLPGYTPLELIEMFYEDGYVTVSDPQSFKKPRSMNRFEMTSLLVSLDLLKSLRTDEISQEIEALQVKLQANMRFENPYVVIQDASDSAILEKLENMISKATPMKISYLSATRDKSSDRIILPLEVYISNRSIYLNAWCQTSNGDRTFRWDRVVNYESLEEGSVAFTRQVAADELVQSNVELLVAKSARSFVEENRAIVEHVTDGDELVLKLVSIDQEWLIRTIIGFGGRIKVLQPVELAEHVRARAAAIRENY